LSGSIPCSLPARRVVKWVRQFQLWVVPLCDQPHQIYDLISDRRTVAHTSSAAGKAFLDMLGVFAELETNLRRERQLEGIADAKARGVYKGRKTSIDPTKVKDMKAKGMGPSAIAKALKIGRASVYRALEA
jgi:DNA invertase Pin-like site-specific DNA recombinase